MNIKVTYTCYLKDNLWGFSDLLNGRELNNETKEEIRELLEEDIYEVIYGNSTLDIEQVD
jgi:hypothetical protein